MKRYLISCLVTLVGIMGGLFIIGGILLIPSGASELDRDNWLRVISLGMTISGIYSLLYRKLDPDYVPEWFKQRLLLYLALLWFLLAAMVFVFSWR